MTDLREDLCARLCLLTKAAWSEAFPKPMTRVAVNKMVAMRVLEGLVLREDAAVSSQSMDQARRLLSRASMVYRCMTLYERAGYGMLLPEDGAWPHKLDRLGFQEPLFLFIKGNEALLSEKKIAVAGSRSILSETQRYAKCVGEMIAGEGRVLVTGGAQGVDECASKATLDAGGNVILIPARAESELIRESWIANALNDGRMLMLYDTLPDEPFSASRALTRNHTIYALGESAIVVAARSGMGGSYHGAMDCLRGGWTPVYVCDGVNCDMEGNKALLREGAKVFSTEKPLVQQTNGWTQMEMWNT